MPHKDFNNVSIIEWIIVTLTALWSAVVAYIRAFKDRNPKSWKTKFWYLFQDFTISGGTTYLVFMLCVGYFDMTTMAACFFAGFMGHNATRVTYLLELAIKQKLGLKDVK